MFHEHYAAARAGRHLEIVKPDRPQAGSLDNLCNRFLAWVETEVEAGNLSKDTLSSRERGLRQACDTT